MGASCTFSTSFVPETAGALTGTIFAQATSANGATSVQSLAYMLGYGAGQAGLVVDAGVASGSPLSFGQVPSGQQATSTVVLSNVGNAPLNIRRLVSEPPFLTGGSCNTQLSSGDRCTVTITYAPVNEIATGSSQSTPRLDTGTLIIESDAASSPDVLNLVGLAVPVVSISPANPSVIAGYQLSQGALTFESTQVGNASAIPNRDAYQHRYNDDPLAGTYSASRLHCNNYMHNRLARSSVQSYGTVHTPRAAWVWRAGSARLRS